MKTEVVLKFDTRLNVFWNSITFNENRSCIEINFRGICWIKTKRFNENRSCIEIISTLQGYFDDIGLMKTEVVLKCASIYCFCNQKFCLMKTEVVLKLS